MSAVYSQRDSTDASLRAHGCGPYVAINALALMSGGRWSPSGKGATTSARYRVRASGVSKRDFNRRGLTSTELATSLHAVRADDVAMDVPVQQRRGVHVADQLLPQLARTGACAAVAVDYGVVQDAGLGYGAYRGGHWVLVSRPRSGEVTVHDPLRRQTVTWPVAVLSRAMERFGTRPWLFGRGEAVVVFPWLTWRQGHAIAKAQLAACEARS